MNGIGDARRDTDICIEHTYKYLIKRIVDFWAVISITEIVSRSCAPINVMARESDKSPEIIRKNGVCVYFVCGADENGDFRLNFSFFSNGRGILSQSCG